jgi:uncharacterized protein (UPF0335 family)
MSESINGTNGQLKALVERIEHEEDAKAEIAEGIKEIYLEVKSGGYDPKIVRKIVAVRRKDSDARQNEESLMDAYMNELGMAL